MADETTTTEVTEAPKEATPDPRTDMEKAASASNQAKLAVKSGGNAPGNIIAQGEGTDLPELFVVTQPWIHDARSAPMHKKGQLLTLADLPAPFEQDQEQYIRELLTIGVLGDAADYKGDTIPVPVAPAQAQPATETPAERVARVKSERQAAVDAAGTLPGVAVVPGNLGEQTGTTTEKEG